MAGFPWPAHGGLPEGLPAPAVKRMPRYGVLARWHPRLPLLPLLRSCALPSVPLQELAHQDIIRQLKLEHAKEITKLRQEFELQVRTDAVQELYGMGPRGDGGVVQGRGARGGSGAGRTQETGLGGWSILMGGAGWQAASLHTPLPSVQRRRCAQDTGRGLSRQWEGPPSAIGRLTCAPQRAR
jgi:hypothetical protein